MRCGVKSCTWKDVLPKTQSHRRQYDKPELQRLTKAEAARQERLDREQAFDQKAAYVMTAIAGAVPVKPPPARAAKAPRADRVVRVKIANACREACITVIHSRRPDGTWRPTTAQREALARYHGLSPAALMAALRLLGVKKVPPNAYSTTEVYRIPKPRCMYAALAAAAPGALSASK